MEFEELPELATKSEAARFLRTSTRTVDRLRKEGELETVRTRLRGVLIPRESLRAYVKRSRQSDDVEEAESAGR